MSEREHTKRPQETGQSRASLLPAQLAATRVAAGVTTCPDTTLLRLPPEQFDNLMYTHTHTYAHAHTHSICINTYVQTHTHTQYTDNLMYTHTLTLTHTHTQYTHSICINTYV